MRELNKIIVHCSVSNWGDATEIDRWHREPPKNYDEIGYHYVILNGYRTFNDFKKKRFDKKLDGLIEEGRALEKKGAQCRGHNHDSIGICLIGDNLFSGRQLYEALPELLIDLCKKYKIEPKEIYGHYELNSGKTCPNIKAEQMKTVVSGMF